MQQSNKVFGVGLPKTGTTTLGACFDILGIVPHVGHRPDLKAKAARSGHDEAILKVAQRYRGFEDSPWCRRFRELDQRFPGSKFILTTRVDGETRARSAWQKNVRNGLARGEVTPEFIAQKVAAYDSHNAAVRTYFATRPDDFLEVCWEKGDGWPIICDFLGVALPDVPFPHRNPGHKGPPGAAKRTTLDFFVNLVSLRARRRIKLAGEKLRLMVARSS